MGTIHFHREQVELAVKLIETKSKYDDINEISTMISTAKPAVEFVNAAKMLDKRINKEYPEINEIHKKASNMVKHVYLYQEKSQSEYDVGLNSNLYGILASALLIMHKYLGDKKHENNKNYN